jgi:hypothetical protein
LKLSELTSLIETFLYAKFQVEIRKLIVQVNLRGDHSDLLQNAIKIKYLGRNKLGTRTHSKVFIGH